jgi:hypothetical protein
MPDLYGSGNTFKVRTSDATPVVIGEISLPITSVGALAATVTARTSAGVRGAWQLFGAGGRELAAPTLISLVLTPISRLDVGAATWAAAIVVTANGLAVQLTGALATSIDWLVITQETVFAP